MAWSIAIEMSLKFCGLPIKRQSSVFLTFPPAVFVTASIRIIFVRSIFSINKQAICQCRNEINRRIYGFNMP